jgi:IS1 family transposase
MPLRRILRDTAAPATFLRCSRARAATAFIYSTGSKSLDLTCGRVALPQERIRRPPRRALFAHRQRREVVVPLQAERPLSETDRALVEIFQPAADRLDNVILYQQLHEANTQLGRVAQRTRALMQANRRLSSQWMRLQRATASRTKFPARRPRPEATAGVIPAALKCRPN